MCKLNLVTRSIVILAILALNISCDQISKGIARGAIQYDERIGLLNDHLTLMKVENTGAFLSLGNTLPSALRIILLIALPVLVMTFGLFFLFSKVNLSKSTLTGLSFVLGGGIGNMYDRIVYGSVTDFMHIDFVIFQKGIFNMADVSILTGMFLILLQPILKERQEKLRY